jgi:hypothetical protein
MAVLETGSLPLCSYDALLFPDTRCVPVRQTEALAATVHIPGRGTLWPLEDVAPEHSVCMMRLNTGAARRRARALTILADEETALAALAAV